MAPLVRRTWSPCGEPPVLVQKGKHRERVSVAAALCLASARDRDGADGGSEPVGERVRIYRRGRSWYANFQYGDKQHRPSLRTKSKKEARRRALRIEAELADGRWKAEREGFSKAENRNAVSDRQFQPKSFNNQTLMPSGHSSLFPVVPRRGGRQPGQIRDKWQQGPIVAAGPEHAPLSGGLPDRIPFFLASSSRRPSRSRRKGPRSRAETEDERRQRHQESEREIDQIVAEFHSLLSRDQAKAIGAIYARYSSQFQHSIGDQVRSLFEAAVKQGIFVPREYVFCDLVVRGYKDSRPGLDQLRAILARRAIQVLLVFTTNRLFRKVYKALQFVEEELVERGIRCLFVKSNIDTADVNNWRLLYQCSAMQDELSGGMYAENVRASQEGLFAKRQVWGTMTFGYRAKEVNGAPTKRRRPRTEWEIDPETASVVRQVFAWYVEDGLSIGEIIRRLNANDNIPLGPKCVSGQWTRQAVTIMLTNARYRGLWAYGKTQKVWQSSKDYSRQVPRRQPLREGQFEELRIVSDETWFKAQKRLAEDPRAGGRKPKDGDRHSRPMLLNGMFYCQEHGRRLHVGGAQGHSMCCPECQRLPADKRPLYSLLNRMLALKLTCNKLADMIRADPSLVAQVIACCRQEADNAQRPNPAVLAERKDRRAKLTRQIQFVMNNMGDTEADQKEAEETLRRMRVERAQVDADIAIQEAAGERVVRVPTEEEVQKLLNELVPTLTEAACSTNKEEVAEAREVIRLLTGGRIELAQQGERKAQRGWLQGRFRVRLVPFLAGKFGAITHLTNAPEVEVVIDYKEPSSAEELAGVVKQMYDQGLLIKQIAKELNKNRNLIAETLDFAFEKAGLPKPDGRSRRASLSQKNLEPPLYQKIALEVKRLMDESLMLGEIATALDCDRNTITKAIQFFYASQNLPAPDGRTRRKMLPKKPKQPPVDDDGTAVR